MARPFRPVLDPLTDLLDLPLLEFLVRVFRRHAERCIRVRDALVHQARVRIAGYDRNAVRSLAEEPFPPVETKVRNPRSWVGSVALKAVVR